MRLVVPCILPSGDQWCISSFHVWSLARKKPAYLARDLEMHLARNLLNSGSLASGVDPDLERAARFLLIIQTFRVILSLRVRTASLVVHGEASAASQSWYYSQQPVVPAYGVNAAILTPQ